MSNYYWICCHPKMESPAGFKLYEYWLTRSQPERSSSNGGSPVTNSKSTWNTIRFLKQVNSSAGGAFNEILWFHPWGIMDVMTVRLPHQSWTRPSLWKYHHERPQGPCKQMCPELSLSAWRNQLSFPSKRVSQDRNQQSEYKRYVIIQA